jgi:hypothetical protein
MLICWGWSPCCTWPPAFLRCWLQLVELKSLCVYFDCDVLLGKQPRGDLITPQRWDELMLPAHHMQRQQQALASSPQAAWMPSSQSQQQPQPQQQQGVATQHQFLLCPVDGKLRYVRRKKDARLLESDAGQEMHLQLQDISVRLHQLQYQSSQKLLQEFDRYAASAPHRHLRPHCRPQSGAQGQQQESCGRP